MTQEQLDALKRIEHDLQTLIDHAEVRSWDYATFKEMKNTISGMIRERTKQEPK